MAPPLGLDRQGWITVVAGLLIALITLFTSYTHVDLPGLGAIPIDQQIGIPLLLASLATLNWRPVVDLEIRAIERERLIAAIERDSEQIKRDCERIANETEQL